MLFTSTPLVLYSSDDVRRTLWELFKAGTERIAITAYVGEGADEYLAHPKGIRLICSPTPGATSPNTLRRLMAKGAVVEFVDALHMKVYWAKNRGTIVTSANLSKNAMGIGGLKEAGVLLGPDEVDIERLLAELDRRPAAPELHRLDVMDKAYYSKLGCKQLRKKISYKTWFTLPNREAWKLLLYAEE